jgi:hypothetical protein
MEIARLHAPAHARSRAPARRRGPAWGRVTASAIVVAALAAAWRYTPLSDRLPHYRIVGWARGARETLKIDYWMPGGVLLMFVVYFVSRWFVRRQAT